MKITFINGSDAGKVFEFSLPEITVGREDANVLRIPTDGVSRYHARFKQGVKGGWTVCDQGSTNGVKVNGERISGECQLQENDRVEIGEQILLVSDLLAEPPKIIFNPVITDSPGVAAGAAPGTAKTSRITGAAKQFENQELLDKISGSSLFSSNEEKEQKEKTDPAARKGKRIMSPMLFYTILICFAVVALTSCLKMFSPGKAAKNAEDDSFREKPVTLFFEKTSIQRDNVFRFALLLENGRATFTIDDIKSRRHPEPLVIENPPGLDVLRGRLDASGIWNSVSPDPGADTSGLRRRLGVIYGTKLVDLVVNGHRSSPEFEEIENAIYEFAEGCGMQTVSMSGDEIMRMASDNFNKAEDLFANRESDGANLRDAISRYRIAVNNLSQFSPAPAMLKTAKSRLAAAEKIRTAKLQDLEYERVRLQNVRDFESLRRVFMETMVLTEPVSQEYNLARKRLHILDVRLKQHRGSR